MTKKERDPKKRAPIVLDDLLPVRDVKGGKRSSVVFGVLSSDDESVKSRKKNK